jgi:hypothetical protein
MWRKLTIAGLTLFLLAAVLLLMDRGAVRVGYYKWQLRSAGEAMFAKQSLGRLFGSLPGVGDAQSRYSRARQALLEVGYLRETRLPFPAGSNWDGLVHRCRERFPDCMWELSWNRSSYMIHLTAPTNQLDAWKQLVSDFATP